MSTCPYCETRLDTPVVHRVNECGRKWYEHNERTRLLAEFKKLASSWRANARKTQDNFVAGLAEQFACAVEETIARLEKE